MRRFLLIILTSLFLSTTSMAQVAKPVLDFYNDFYSRKVAEDDYLNKTQRYEGSPYDNKKFVASKVVLNNGVFYENIPLRYNIYNQQMEFEKDKVAYYITNMSLIDSIIVRDKKYLYADYYAKKKR